jgi:PAS domain S-box-containing protein
MQYFKTEEVQEEMARLEQTRDRERLHTLFVVNDMLRQAEADGLDLVVILPRILRVAIQELAGGSGSILIVDENKRVMDAWVLTTLGQTERLHPFLDRVVSDGLAGWVLGNGRPALVENTLADERWLANPPLLSSKQARSAIAAPLVARGRPIGVLTINKDGTQQFAAEDAALLAAIANQAATTIENARLYQESQQRAEELAELLAVTRLINSSLDINEIMQSLLAQRNELLHAEALSIALVDKQRNELVYQYAEGVGSEKIVGLRLPSNQGITGWVMEHGEPALVADTSVDPRFSSDGDKRTGHDTRSLICAPLLVKGEVLGTIQAINPQQGSFTMNDLALLVNLASLASSAIANAQQYARTQAAEERYASLFEDSIDAIILTDKYGSIVEANHRACYILGYSREELRNMRISALHPVETGLLGDSAFRAIGGAVRVFTSQAITKSRARIPVEVHAKRLMTADNELLQWIHHDISKQVELERLREEMTAMLVHDLQSPLSNIITSLQIVELELEPANNATMDAFIDAAMRSSQKLQVLIRSLLDINRLESGQPLGNLAQVSLRKLVADAQDVIQPGADRRGVQVQARYDGRLDDVYADEDMVRRILVNLLDNALKFSPPDTKITVEVSELLVDNKLVISVSDQGPGIPPQQREVIFDKFSRLQRGDAPGMGIGLAFCRLAVEAHGGRIWVEDAPGGGARFSFMLPTKK